jgi:antitoxin YefM
MITISYSEARQNLSETMSKTVKDKVHTLITRQRGRSCVLISLDDYNALQETAYLMSNSANAKHLINSIEELRSGKGKHKELIEK